jgi:hypothetical protein
MTAGVTEAHSSSTAVQVIDLGSQRSVVTKKMIGFPTFKAGVLIGTCTRPEIWWQCHPLVNHPREKVIKVPRACSRAREDQMSDIINFIHCSILNAHNK